MEEEEETRVSSRSNSAGDSLYAAPFPRSTIINCITNTTQRSCIPTVYGAAAATTTTTTYNEYNKASPLRCESSCKDKEPQSERRLPVNSLMQVGMEEQQPVSQASSPDRPYLRCAMPFTPSPTVQEQCRRKGKVTLSSRWRPYANGAVHRYNVASRMMPPRDPNEEHRFNTLEEMARRRANDSKAYRPTKIALPTRGPTNLPLVVRALEEDPREVADKAKQAIQAEVPVPYKIMEKKLLFDATVGTVKPYVLGDINAHKRRRLRPGKKDLSMPQSALTQDPLLVFVETMRYQRPALGIYSFQV